MTSPLLNAAEASVSPTPAQENKEPPNEMVTIAIAVAAVGLAVIGVFALSFIGATLLCGGGGLGALAIAGSIALITFGGTAFIIKYVYDRVKEARDFFPPGPPAIRPASVSVQALPPTE